MKPTQIIATLGPSTDKPGILKAMLIAGVDVIRLNLSHSTYAQHQARVDLARATALELAKPLGIMADLQGPKIRIGRFTTGSIHLKTNDPFMIDSTLPLDQGTQQAVGIHYPHLSKDLKVGDQLLLDDGFIVLVVDNIIGTAVHCIVQLGGKLSDHKGINRRGGGLSAEALTPKDRKDIDFAAKLKVDFVALSFARCAADVQETRALLRNYASFRWGDGCTWRFRGRMWLCRITWHPKAYYCTRPCFRSSCDYSNPNDGKHGASCDPNACRSIRCGQCRVGWHHSSHAIGRNSRR